MEKLKQPLYAFSEADRLASLSSGTARRWLLGHPTKRSGETLYVPPVLERRVDQSVDGVSFLDLVQLAALGKLKGLGFSIQLLRKVVENAREMFQVEYPLASRRFKAGGGEIFAVEDGQLVEVGRRKRRQAWDEVLAPFLESVDYLEDVDLACRWWPLGREERVVLDPEYGFGMPVVAGSGVRTEIIREQFEGASR